MTEVAFQNRRTRPCVYFQQGKCNRPQCNFSHDLLAPPAVVSNAPSDSSSSQTPSINTPASRSQVASDDVQPPPIRPTAFKTKPCRFYARGRCTAGDQCRWSHEEGAVGDDEYGQGPEEEYQANGYKLVPKSYRTQPCARFLAGHCYYGEQCNFIHASSQTSSASTPSGQNQPTRDLGPSPPQVAYKAHSTQHSPAISSLHASAIRSSISVATPPPSTVSAVSSAPTRPRELPPPQSQAHYSGIDWSVPTIGTPNVPAKGGTATPPVYASSPLIPSGPPILSRSNSMIMSQTQDVPPTTQGLSSSQGHVPSQMRSPFLFTFGEIGPGSAMNSPRGLGLNGANLALPGAVSTTNGGASAPLASPSLVSGRLAAATGGTSNGRMGSPGLGSASALGTTGITMIRQKSRLSTSTDVYPEVEGSDGDADAETEPDFPTINYTDLKDLVTEPDEEPHDTDGLNVFGVVNPPRHNSGGYLTPNGYSDLVAAGIGPSGVNGAYGAYVNGVESDGLMSPYAPNGGVYERDWGIALNALQGAPAPSAYGGTNASYADGYGMAFKTRACKFYVAGSRCPAGQNCTFIHDPEALRRPSAAFMSAPMPPEMHPLYRTRECKYHLAGRCHQEGTCAFKHTGPPGQGREYENWEGFSIQVNDHETAAEDRGNYRSRPCKWFLKGNCFHGENCTYSHTSQYVRPACIFFRNGTGNCINGDDCRFSHDVYQDDDSSYAEQMAEGSSDFAPSGTQVPTPSEHHMYMPPVLSTTFTEDDEVSPPHPYNEPYFVGMGGSVNGIEGLTVQGPRMELIVSEGEEDEEEDDVVVLRPNVAKKVDPTVQDVEKLFAASSF